MRRFFDYPQKVWDYFEQVNRRLAAEAPQTGPAVRRTQPADVPPYWDIEAPVRAVIWDIYGTLCGVDVGDLEASLSEPQRLQKAARATIEEFDLTESLQKAYPDREPDQALRDRYLALIETSHAQSREAGIRRPEVMIERIWEEILQACRTVGYRAKREPEGIWTAYRAAYFFDCSLQRTFLYEGAWQTLLRLREAGLRQGIISNAQFYTPIHLRRLLRQAGKQADLELETIFEEPLVRFSYELGYSKPNPGAFVQVLEVLREQGIEPSQVLYAGNDMLNDIWAAQQAGMRGVFYAGDRRQAVRRPEEARCDGLRAEAVVTRLETIAEHLERTQGKNAGTS